MVGITQSDWVVDLGDDGALDDLPGVLALAVSAPPGVHPVLVVLDAVHVEERGDECGDGPEERDDQLQEHSPETQEVPETEDPPERPVLAEGGVAPVEEAVVPGCVLERRLDITLRGGRPCHSRVEVVPDVLSERGLELVVGMVGLVGLASDGDEHRTSHRCENEPEHRQKQAAGTSRPQQVPRKHADGDQVQRQPDQGPGEATCSRLGQVDRFGLELTSA